jgi:hypothetical protein
MRGDEECCGEAEDGNPHEGGADEQEHGFSLGTSVVRLDLSLLPFGQG